MSEHVEMKLREAEDGPANLAVDLVYIYLYYLKFPSAIGKPTVTRAYFCSDVPDSGSAADLQKLIAKFAVNAYADDKDPSSFGPSLDGLARWRKGYVAVVVDAPGQKLGTGTLTFRGYFDDAWNDGTHTFSRSRQIQVPVQEGGATRDIVVLYSANGLNEPDMTDLDEGESEYFRFTLTFNGTAAGTARGFPYEDSGGTNMGPPVGPPYAPVGIPIDRAPAIEDDR